MTDPQAVPSQPLRRDPYLPARLAMVEQQVRRRGISNEHVLYALETLPRHEFVPTDSQREAYDDRALPIGFGQTISQPYMVGLMLSLLEVDSGHRVLEVGAGSGYVCALLGMLTREVYGLELVPELAERAAAMMQRLELTNVHILAGDGSVGYPEAAPFDRILVSAATPALPAPLADQLAEGGRLLAPIGGRSVQTCRLTIKRNGELRTRDSIECMFVPLRGEHGWHDGA